VTGNLREAKIHLHAISQMVNVVGMSEDSKMWLPVANAKISTSLLAPTPLNIPWPREDLPSDILQRITPTPSSPQARQGTSFDFVAGLSDHLRRLMMVSRDICNLCEYSAMQFGGLSTRENGLLSRKATELEHDLVAYPFQSPEFFHDGDKEPTIGPLEAIVRVAALGLLQITPSTILSSSGVGRALTDHHRSAIDKWLRQKDADTSISELRLMTWALFVFAQRATGQPEQEGFITLLSQTLGALWLQSWHDVEVTVQGFLFMPKLLRDAWMAIWDRATAEQHHQHHSQIRGAE
jgi:hypothetical protein